MQYAKIRLKGTILTNVLEQLEIDFNFSLFYEPKNVGNAS